MGYKIEFDAEWAGEIIMKHLCAVEGEIGVGDNTDGTTGFFDGFFEGEGGCLDVTRRGVDAVCAEAEG